MLKIAIVDDAPSFITHMTKLLTDLFARQSFEVTFTAFSNAASCLTANEQSPFDVLFLDIDIPDMSGIQLASRLRSGGSEAAILFVSAHSHFVYESIHYAPFRFIRKDYLESETAEAVEALCRHLQQNKHQITLDTSGGTIMKVNLSEIVCFFAMQHSIFLYNADKETIELAHRTYTMEKLEELTAPYGFMRTHKAWLLSPRFIYQIGTDTITLVSEVSKNEHDEIPMSRRRAAQMREQFRTYLRREGLL